MKIWDRLGGRDSLELWIGAEGFVSKWDKYACCTYRGLDGCRRRLAIIQDRTGLTIQITPAKWTQEWFKWVLSSDRQLRFLHSYAYLHQLTDERLVQMVEDVLEMSTNPFC